MAIKSWFPTRIYQSQLAPARMNSSLVRELLKESYQIAEGDREGQRWSKENYPGGYTSYGSMSQLHRMSSTFAVLEKHLNRHVARFAKHLEFDMSSHKLEMSSCWVNIVPKHVYHGLHLHPISTLSGTFYLSTPAGSGDLRFEDPRLSRLMASPPRKDQAGDDNRIFVRYKPRVGEVLLWESWLRHEVLQNQGARDRVSISFNYNWF